VKYCARCGSALEIKQIDGVQRQVCSRAGCDYVVWNNPVPVVAALVEYEGKYVIARNAQWPKRIFSLVTGYLEAGETPEQAVLREVEEELALSGKIHQHIGNYAFFAKNQIILCYEVQATGMLMPNHELAEVKLLLPDELAEYDFDHLQITKNIIADWKWSR
jgi:NAD+ diphosphatase